MAKSDKLSPLCNELYSRQSLCLTDAHATTCNSFQCEKKNLKGTSRHSFENYSKTLGGKEEGISHLSKII